VISLLLEWRHAKKLAVVLLSVLFVLTGFYFMNTKNRLVAAQSRSADPAAPSVQMRATSQKAGKYADRIQQVTSPKGIRAWLVEDHSIPLMAMQFAFKGGSSQDPEGKAGLANFLTSMLDEGAGDIKSKKFQALLDEMAIRMDFDATRDAFSGSFKTLTRNRDKAVELIHLALNRPRFDKKALERMRGQLLAGLKFDAKNPNRIATRAWFEAAYGDHPYGRPVKGTEKSLKSITADDLEQYRRRVFAHPLQAFHTDRGRHGHAAAAFSAGIRHRARHALFPGGGIEPLGRPPPSTGVAPPHRVDRLGDGGACGAGRGGALFLLNHRQHHRAVFGGHHIEGAAGGGVVHHLDAHARGMAVPHERRRQETLPPAGAQNDDLRFQRQQRIQMGLLKGGGIRHLPPGNQVTLGHVETVRQTLVVHPDALCVDASHAVDAAIPVLCEFHRKSGSHG